MQLQVIQQKIFEIRGQKVMLDFDLAALYKVETRVLNQAVKRNTERFPKDFMFRLTDKKWDFMSSQFVMTSPGKRPKTALPYAFTEHGVTMLASILKSDTAVKMNIAIVRAFIALKKFAIQYDGLLEQLDELRGKIGGYDAQLNQIYEALENMLDKKAEEENKKEAWDNRKRIGFKN
ncbi:MAG: ORF6N domain-containing protein [Ginsengibacter sp.]